MQRFSKNKLSYKIKVSPPSATPFDYSIFLYEIQFQKVNYHFKKKKN